MRNPFYELNHEDVERFLALDAVKYSFPVFCNPTWRTGRRADPDSEYAVHCGLVYFWSGAGDEIGYANTFGCPIVLFDAPRAWDAKIKSNQKWFDLTPGKSENPLNGRRTIHRIYSTP